jgi:arylsulfatase A-like enzyme
MARLTSLITLGLWLVATWCAAAEPSAQPNIIVFIVDDMGWQDTSVPFHSERTPLNDKFRTPNMQRLADRGMKFTQAYACSVCTPTRVSLMTGLNAARHRVTNWTLHKNVGPDAKHPTLRFPEWNVNGLCATPGVERTVYAKPLPEFLREAGYRTIHVGKAHWGAIGTPGANPKNLGFDENIAGHAAGGPGNYLGTKNFGNAKPGGVTPPWGVPGLEAYHGKDIFLTEALTIEANKAVDRAVADGKPFYLYMAHYAVHVPYAPDSRFLQTYLDAGLDRTEAMYAALVAGMDKSLGDILDNLNRLKITENTIVLFLSDNGGLSAHLRGGKPHTHNAPLSSGKGSAHEGGIRVPMIVDWPGVTRPGSVCDSPVIIEDFFPTILEMAGIKNPKQIDGVIDGVSFVPLLNGQPPTNPNRAFYWHYPNNWGPTGPGIGASSTIRDGDWKLIHYYADDRYELFNLKTDLSEKHNLADEQPEVRDRLARKLGDYLQSVKAQLPTRRN